MGAQDRASQGRIRCPEERRAPTTLTERRDASATLQVVGGSRAFVARGGGFGRSLYGAGATTVATSASARVGGVQRARRRPRRRHRRGSVPRDVPVCGAVHVHVRADVYTLRGELRHPARLAGALRRLRALMRRFVTLLRWRVPLRRRPAALRRGVCERAERPAALRRVRANMPRARDLCGGTVPVRASLPGV